jgi:hypothetical protein
MAAHIFAMEPIDFDPFPVCVYLSNFAPMISDHDFGANAKVWVKFFHEY